MPRTWIRCGFFSALLIGLVAGCESQPVEDSAPGKMEGGAMGKMDGGAMGKMESGKMEGGAMGKMESGKMEPAKQP
ncbi:MAG: hypothetical protein SFX72_20665 [Isosphaeraceae bacterium]|nr:hypothetical protein [Isosphaeraceae bacterium]